MKKTVLATTIAFTSSAFAYNFSAFSSSILTFSTKYNPCSPNTRVTVDSLDEDNYRFAGFLLSPSYCINNSKFRSSIKPNFMLSKAQISALYRNYYQAYESLKLLDDKIHFVHYFLKEASKKYFLTSAAQSHQDELRLVFYSPKGKGNSRGYSFYPFAKGNFTQELAMRYQVITEEDQEPPKDIQIMVDKILAFTYLKR